MIYQTKAETENAILQNGSDSPARQCESLCVKRDGNINTNTIAQRTYSIYMIMTSCSI